MLTLFRHYFLMLAVLLTAIGNMNMLSFCECNSGIFIGSCACDHKEAKPHNDAFESAGTRPNSSSIAIGTHHCHHVALANNDLAQISQTTPAQIVPTPQFIAPSNFVAEHISSPRLSCSEIIFVPPDPPLLSQTGGLGFCRPLII